MDGGERDGCVGSSPVVIVNYLSVAMILFLIGVLGIVLNRKNLIVMLMSVELMLLAINLNFIVYSILLNDVMGQIFSLFVLTVAAAESAIGLAILIAYYRVRGSIAVIYINLLRN